MNPKNVDPIEVAWKALHPGKPFPLAVENLNQLGRAAMVAAFHRAKRRKA